MTTLGICLSLMRAGLHGQLQYRLNFLNMILMGLAYQGTGFIFIWVVLSQFQAVAGWSLGDIAFLYGLRLTLHAVGAILFTRFRALDWIIRDGQLDRYLVRPLTPFLHLLCEQPRVSVLGDLLGGVVLFAAANRLVAVDWSPMAVVYLVWVILGGALLEMSLKLCAATFAFRFLQAGNLVGLLDHLLSDFGNYPLKIFGGTLEFLLTFGLPLAFVAYFPSTVLLGRTSELSVSPWFTYLSPLVGLGWFAVAYRFWQHELRHYQSAGH